MTAKTVGRAKSKLALTISSQQKIAQNELSVEVSCAFMKEYPSSSLFVSQNANKIQLFFPLW